jgi:hypothetical protein
VSTEKPEAAQPGEVTGLLREHWRAVLEVPEVAGRDDFFAAGGNSMLATRLMSRLRRQLGPQLPVGMIFDHPVFADLAGELSVWLASPGPWAGPVASGRASGPVSLQQEELLQVEQLLGPSPVHNIVMALTGPATVPAPALRRALQWVVNQHPALRLAFPAGSGQVVGPPLTASEIDLTVLDDPGDEATIRTALRRAHLRPFHLERGCLLRAQLFRRPTGDLIALHLHHLSVDGVSQAIVLDDLAGAFGALAAGAAPATTPDGPTYVDYAAWQRSACAELLARSRPHWAGVAATLAAGRAPGDPGPAGVRYRRHATDIPAATMAALRGWTQPEGVTDFVALAAAAAVAVARLRGQTQAGVGALLDGRQHAAVERLVGPFATSTLLAADIAAAGTPRALVRALAALLDQPCAELGLEPSDLVDVVVALDQPREPAGSPALPLTAVPDQGEPLLSALIGAPPSVSLFRAGDGSLRVSAEAAGTDPAGASVLADEVAAVAGRFATGADIPLAPSRAAVP